jgi:hypothetical protein
VYHRAAKKLLHYGKKMMHVSKLLSLKEEFPELDEITYDDLTRDFQSGPVDASPASAADKE